MEERFYCMKDRHSSDLPYTDKQDPWSSHSIIYGWLKTLPPGIKILDIGTSTGMIGKRCAGLGFLLKGIEPVQEWAEQARPYYEEILPLNLEQAPDDFIANQDVIILADVLEHMTDPGITLGSLVRIQKPTSQFLISVPNVANIWIRLSLLFGKFNYSNNGILDRTHLRFFTKRTLLNMLKTSGLNPIEIKSTPIPLGRVSSFFSLNPIGRILHNWLAIFTSIYPELFAYQFVVRAEIMDKEIEL